MMGYLESLGAIQNVFRAQTRDQLLVVYGTLSAAEGKFLQRFSLAFRRLLGAVSIDKNGDWGRVVYVGAALEDMIGYLNREHPRTLGLRSRKITTDVPRVILSHHPGSSDQSFEWPTFPARVDHGVTICANDRRSFGGAFCLLLGLCEAESMVRLGIAVANSP